MQKISAYTLTADSSGEFTNGSSASGSSPTNLDAGWFNMVQRELINMATAAGLTLDVDNDAQLLASLKALFLTLAGGTLTGSLTVAGSVAATKSASGALGGVLQAVNQSSDAESSAELDFEFASSVMASIMAAVASNGSTTLTFSVNEAGTLTDRRTVGLTIDGSAEEVNSAFPLYENGSRVYSPNNKPGATDVGALPISGGTLTGSVTSEGDVSANGGFYGSVAIITNTVEGDQGALLALDNEATSEGSTSIVAYRFGTGLDAMGAVYTALNSDGSTSMYLQVCPAGTISDRRKSAVSIDGQSETVSSAYPIYENGERVYSPNNPPSKGSGVGLWSQDLVTGIITQWGYSETTTGGTVTFPIAFPTACSAVVGTIVANLSAGSSTANVQIHPSPGTTSFVYTKGSNETGIFWQAKGY